MQGKDAAVGKFYLPPRVKQPLEVVELLRVNGEGPITEVNVKNLVSGNQVKLPSDYELGDEIAAEEVEGLVAQFKAAGTAAKAAGKEKKDKKAPKAIPPVETAPAESEASQAAPAVETIQEDTTMVTKKKKSKTAGELRGRPRDGAPTRSGVIDKLLARGKNTCAQIVDEVMKDSSLKVPKGDAKKIRTLVSVRISRAQAAGGKYHRDKETKIVRVDFKEKPVKVAKPKKEKKAK